MMIWRYSAFTSQFCRLCNSRNNFKSWIFNNRSIQTGITHLNNGSKPNGNVPFQINACLNLKQLTSEYGKINFENITSQEGQFLLQCCGTMTPNCFLEERTHMCQNVFSNLVKHNKLDIDIYHTYIQICTENRTLINSKTFLENLKLQPDSEIFKLLLENACECGDLSQAFILLEMMKQKNLTVDESIFNNLVLVHTLKGGLEAGEKVLATMKAAQVKESIQTQLAVLRGIIRSEKYEDFQSFLTKYPLSLNEDELLIILKELGLAEKIHWISEINSFFSHLELSRDFMIELKNVCIYLIYMKKPDSAVELFKYFQQDPDENNVFSILEEMLHSKADPDEIISKAKYFRDNHGNTHIFVRLSEVALRNQYFEAAWKLFKHLEELRPHYFWPMLVGARNTEGESGLLRLVEKINEMGLKLDSDSLEYYVLPFCNVEDVKLLIEKFKIVGYTVRDLLSPMLLVLLDSGQVKKASEICEFYNSPIQGDRLFKFICLTWRNTKDSCIVTILQKYCECTPSKNDLVGEFLVRSLKSCKSKSEYEEFVILLQNLHRKKLKTTSTSAEILRDILTHRLKPMDHRLCDIIFNQLDQILEFKLQAEPDYIPHPRDMTIDELECHLVELSQKNMKTRGILRKLIQMHANAGNVARVKGLRMQFIEAGYEETLGLKSHLMHSYTKIGNFEAALDVYKEIRQSDPKFAVDEHKIVDLCAVLVKNDKLNEANGLLEEASSLRRYGGKGIQRNCIELLSAFQNENDQSAMLNNLVEKGYCKFNNVMLGPLVRLFLNRGDLEKAADIFVKLTEKYKCTPLQYELIRAIAQSKNEMLLQQVLDSSSNVHGPLSTQANLIGALAEIGEDNILKKILASTKFQIKDELNRRCERWIKEGKSEALLTLANSCMRMSSDLVDTDFLHESIIKTYALTNDCESAVRFYENLVENEIPVNRKLENQLHTLLKLNNYSSPSSLRANNRRSS